MKEPELMRRPFGVLVGKVENVLASDHDYTLGELSQRWDEPIERIMDAIDCIRIMHGEPAYFGQPIEESDF